MFRFALVGMWLILMSPQNAWAHAALGTGFERPRSALERAAHTEALVIAEVTEGARPIELPDHVPASTLAFEVKVLETIAGNAPREKFLVMQLGKKQLAYPTKSIILLSISRTAHFVAANVPRPAELPPPANAPAWFTEQTRAETVEIDSAFIPAIRAYIAKTLPFEKLDDPLERTAGLFRMGFQTLQANKIHPLLGFETIRDLLIASLDVKPHVSKESAYNLLRLSKNTQQDFRAQHGAVVMLFKAEPIIWRPIAHEMIKTPSIDARLHALTASQLARQPTESDAALFVSLLGNQDEYLVRSAIIGLGKLSHKPALNHFENISINASEEIGRTLVSALALMNLPDAKKMLKNWSQNHPQTTIQALAARQLIRSR